MLTRTEQPYAEVSMKLIGHGIDVVEVARVRDLLATSREDFEPAWFTSGEQEAARQHPDPAPFYARRHAAKEAVFKALGTALTQEIAPTDVEIRTQESGAPVVVLSGGALAIAKRLGIRRWLLSISDTEHLAIASVLALQDDN